MLAHVELLSRWLVPTGLSKFYLRAVTIYR
jgi:hypothetical protein